MGISPSDPRPLRGVAPAGSCCRSCTGDGRADALAAVSSGVAILENQGDADLQVSNAVAMGQRPVDIALMEATGDGRLDLVAALSNGVSIFAGDGTGRFTSATSLPENLPQGLAVADFTGDGRADLAVVSAGDSAIDVYPGTATGLSATPLFTPLSFGDQLVVADLNGDGLVDLLVVTGGASASGGAAGQSAEFSSVTVLQGDGAGHFTDVGTIAGNGVAVAVADLDGDRLPEVIVADANLPEVRIAANATDTTITPGDIDADGQVSSDDEDQIVAEIFDGDGNAAMSCGGGTLRTGAAADVNGDGLVGAADLTELRLAP